MKTVSEVIEEKLYLHFPKSMQIIEEALEYMVENNLNNTTGVILMEELSKDYKEQEIEVTSFRKLLFSKGFACSTEAYNSIFLGHKEGVWNGCYNVYISNDVNRVPVKNKELKLYTMEKPFKLKEDD